MHSSAIVMKYFWKETKLYRRFISNSIFMMDNNIYFYNTYLAAI